MNVTVGENVCKTSTSARVKRVQEETRRCDKEEQKDTHENLRPRLETKIQRVQLITMRRSFGCRRWRRFCRRLRLLKSAVSVHYLSYDDTAKREREQPPPSPNVLRRSLALRCAEQTTARTNTRRNRTLRLRSCSHSRRRSLQRARLQRASSRHGWGTCRGEACRRRVT